MKNSPSNAGGAGSIPGWGAKILHALQPKRKHTHTHTHTHKTSNIEVTKYLTQWLTHSDPIKMYRY